MGWKGKEEAEGTQSLGAEVPAGVQDGREGNWAQSPLVSVAAEPVRVLRSKGTFLPRTTGTMGPAPTDLHSLSFKAEASLQSLPLPGLCLRPHTVPTSPTLPPWVPQAQTGSLAEPGGSKQRRHQSLEDPWSPSGRARGPGPRAPVCHLGSDKGVGARVPQSPGQGLPHRKKINVK